jgi:hypothetical protein
LAWPAAMPAEKGVSDVAAQRCEGVLTGGRELLRHGCLCEVVVRTQGGVCLAWAVEVRGGLGSMWRCG